VSAADVEGSRAIRLPLTAIYDRTGMPQVWVVDTATSKVSALTVKLGAARNDTVLIAGGLNGGETIVTAGVNMLHPGQKVKLLGAPAAVAKVQQ
jgi:membrane fusion protein, multidrug efflux system